MSLTPERSLLRAPWMSAVTKVLQETKVCVAPSLVVLLALPSCIWYQQEDNSCTTLHALVTPS
jgi:hypothetical protein